MELVRNTVHISDYFLVEGMIGIDKAGRPCRVVAILDIKQAPKDPVAFVEYIDGTAGNLSAFDQFTPYYRWLRTRGIQYVFTAEEIAAFQAINRMDIPVIMTEIYQKLVSKRKKPLVIPQEYERDVFFSLCGQTFRLGETVKFPEIGSEEREPHPTKVENRLGDIILVDRDRQRLLIHVIRYDRTKPADQAANSELYWASLDEVRAINPDGTIKQ